MKKRKVIIMSRDRWSDEQAICYTTYVTRPLTLGKRLNISGGRILMEGDLDILIAKYKKKKNVVLYERDVCIPFGVKKIR